MNPKLPFLLCLLAAGVYFWTSNRSSLSDVGSHDASGAGIEFEVMTPSDVTPVDDAAINGDQLVANAADRLINGPQLHAQARFKIDLLDQQFAAPGQYWQQGSGTGKSRLEFSHHSERSRFSVLQVCDGRYFYWFRKYNSQSHLEYVDLRQVQQLGNREPDFLAGARAWNNVGGLTSMLEHTSKAFHFAPPQRARLDEIPVHIVQGRWKQDALVRLLEGQVDPQLLRADDWWRHVPPHLPHAVELTLGADDRFPEFPYRVVFSQYHTESEQVVLRPVVTLELFELREVAEIPEQTFQVAAVNCEPVDVTAFYVDRVEQFTRR